METIKLKAHIGRDGILELDTPTPFKDVETEVLIVLQIVNDTTDALGWPHDYFARIDAIQADDVTERGEQGVLESRTPFN